MTVEVAFWWLLLLSLECLILLADTPLAELRMGTHRPIAVSFANVIFSDPGPRSMSRAMYRNPNCSFSCNIQRMCYFLGLTIQSKIDPEPAEVTGRL